MGLERGAMNHRKLHENFGCYVHGGRGEKPINKKKKKFYEEQFSPILPE